MARLYQGAAQEEAGPQMSLILVQNFFEELPNTLFLSRLRLDWSASVSVGNAGFLRQLRRPASVGVGTVFGTV